jgi:quercetin dioxygenase-like cupin family protein
MKKITIRDHARFQADKMAKIALGQTERALLDLYCVAPGQTQKPHTHGDQDKIYVVLEGRGRISVGGSEDTLGPGEAVIAEAGVEHGLVNDGPANLLLLVVVTPPPLHMGAPEERTPKPPPHA